MKDLISCVEPMIPALRRYARALLRDRDLADDLVQDCLERVISRWERRRQAADTRQWVFAIAHNLAVDLMRRQSRRGPHLTIDDVDEAETAVQAPQEDHMRHHELMRAMEALPEDQRCVLLLVSVEDMSYAEAGKTLGIPIGTVMSRLSRARKRLLHAMGGDGKQQTTPAGNPALRRMK